MTDAPIAERFIHSTYLRKLGPYGQDDAVVAKVHRHYQDGRVEPHLKIIRNPSRRFYTTLPGIRDTYTEKKEWEDLHNLEAHTCKNADMPREIFRALNGFYPKAPPSLRKLAESPYLYGADISIESLIKAAHREKFDAAGVSPIPITTGVFDVESSMSSHNFGQLIMASISHEEKIYTSVLRSNLFVVDAQGNRKPGNIEDVAAFARKRLDASVVFPGKRAQRAIGKRVFQLHFHLAETPLEMLQWLMGKMHENRTDFMCAWNLPFDMQRVLETCAKANYAPERLLCPPELDRELRSARFVVDPGQKDAHYTRRWHWLYAPAYTQWYDAMCLYSILRVVDGFEASYELGDVLRENDVCDGKLTFDTEIPDAADMSKADWHRYMQQNHPYEYVTYNVFDVMSVQVMEWINSDASGMHVLIGNSALQNFNKQTRRAADSLHFKCLRKNKVVAATGAKAEDGEDIIVKHGGAVLPPERTWQSGLPVIIEAPTRDTCVHGHVSDIDLKAIYPNVDQAFNVSRETKLATMLRIEGFPDVEMRTYASMIAAIYENAVPIGIQYYGLPGYDEAAALFLKQRQKA